MSAVPAPNPENIHPSLWRASQLARGRISTIDTGYPALSAELPGGGWPVSSLVEILAQTYGCGEMRLIAPALAKLAGPVLLVGPPAEPSAHGLAYTGISPERLILVRSQNSRDQLWSAEQALTAGTCAAVLLWQKHVRADSLRRLLLAARSTTSLFFVMRHLSDARDASPADLRIAVKPSEAGASVEILKRKGPRFEGTIDIDLNPATTLLSNRARVRRGTAPVEPIHVPEGVHA
ncbi:translesion DNA synthesis-associated protein ImuA [Paraburkholderia hospita]|uniref:translesion DNA synthesis-associated protein ImuA n=1 Tax=Paraburkholderia hospita TaxID=169430 RepID=UPI000B34998A|nr:translesion DNA synthesis-associated protein ImuA [Paraburkholderia hospita]OUL79957.1 recombinase RecA [Paraburkholderia hospita]